MYQLTIVFPDGRQIPVPIVGMPQGEFTVVRTFDGAFVFCPRDCVLVGRLIDQQGPPVEAPAAQEEPNPVEVAEQIVDAGWEPETGLNGTVPAAPKRKHKGGGA